jgi:aminoglycoside 2'-N-acetyltransferase I
LGKLVDVQVLATSAMSPGLAVVVRQLLEDAFEGDLSDEDWDHCLGGWHVLVTEDDVPLSHAAVVPRVLQIAGRRWRCGYVEGMATAPHRQGTGLGSLVMQWLGRLIRTEFEIGALSTSAHSFYQRHGWERWQGPS